MDCHGIGRRIEPAPGVVADREKFRQTIEIIPILRDDCDCGAEAAFFRFPLDKAGNSRSFAGWVVTNARRIGEQLALVGPSLASSYRSVNIDIRIGVELQTEWVLARVKICASASLAIGWMVMGQAP